MIEALYLFTGIALTLLIFVDILFTPIHSPDLQMLLDAKVKLVENRKDESQRKALWTELIKSKGTSWNEVCLVSQDRN